MPPYCPLGPRFFPAGRTERKESEAGGSAATWAKSGSEGASSAAAASLLIGSARVLSSAAALAAAETRSSSCGGTGNAAVDALEEDDCPESPGDTGSTPGRDSLSRCGVPKESSAPTTGRPSDSRPASDPGESTTLTAGAVRDSSFGATLLFRADASSITGGDPLAVSSVGGRRAAVFPEGSVRSSPLPRADGVIADSSAVKPPIAARPPARSLAAGGSLPLVPPRLLPRGAPYDILPAAGQTNRFRKSHRQ